MKNYLTPKIYYEEVNSLLERRILSPLCIAIAIFALILIGFGVYLITSAFGAPTSIGLIVAGILLLISCCSRFVPQIVCCAILVIIGLFLVVVGIIAIPIDLVIGIILIVLAIISLILAAICFAISLDYRRHDVEYQDS